MPTYSYRPRYIYSGPTYSNPLLDELSEDEVERNVRLLAEDLRTHFGEINGVVEELRDGVIRISTDLTQRQCDDIVAGYLRNLYLVADKVAQ